MVCVCVCEKENKTATASFSLSAHSNSFCFSIQSQSCPTKPWNIHLKQAYHSSYDTVLFYHALSHLRVISTTFPATWRDSLFPMIQNPRTQHSQLFHLNHHQSS